jgi:Protein of unknown function (DUF1822)
MEMSITDHRLPIKGEMIMNTSQSTMNDPIENFTFSVPLMLTAHTQAKEFVRHQANQEKAKQVYLNTLAVYAVNFYLECQGFETNVATSNSWDPVMQTLLDVADLDVKNRGKLECRPVVPGSKIVRVPAEVWDDRIGYVAVQFDELLQEATLLGFAEAVKCEELPLSQLQSLEELPGYLEELPGYLDKIQPPIDLSQWLEGVFAEGWEKLENLLQTRQPQLVFRLKMAQRCKLIELGESGESVEMIVKLTEASEAEFDISVMVRSPHQESYLPANLQLMLMDEDGETVLDAYARNDNQTIELEFTGSSGDNFSVKVVLGDICITEKFLL